MGAAGARWARALAVVWFVVMLAIWADALQQASAFLRGVPAARGMCQGLPSYEALGREASPASPLGFWSDETLTRRPERFACAQFSLAPRILTNVDAIDGRALAARHLHQVLMDDGTANSAAAAKVSALDPTADVQPLGEGLFLLTLRRP